MPETGNDAGALGRPATAGSTAKPEPHPLDFEHRCCFREQVVNIGRGLQQGQGEEVVVPMRSGRDAIYSVTSTPYNTMIWDQTDQRNWRFEFLRYADEIPEQ